jgi:hypothetical protein
VYACNETNLIHYLPAVYSVTISLRVSGLLVTHHQEVRVYICKKWYVLYVLVDWQLAGLWWERPTSTRPTDSQLKRSTRIIRCVYTLLSPDGQLASPKHVEVYWLNKLNINCVSSLFNYTNIARCSVNKTYNSTNFNFYVSKTVSQVMSPSHSVTVDSIKQTRE